MDRMGNALVFEYWLRNLGYSKLIDKDVGFNKRRKIQETRHAWLDSLIKEFS